MSGRKPMVCVVDDDAAVRESICALIGSLDTEVRDYASGNAFLGDPAAASADCLVLDVRLPGISGLELQERLQDEQTPIVFVSAHGDIAMAVRAIRAGALDFLEKPFSSQDLLDRVQQAVEISDARRRERRRRETVAARLALLTPREKEVLERVVQGQANKAIAEALRISVRTVEQHRAQAMVKMHAESLAALVLDYQLIQERQAAGRS